MIIVRRILLIFIITLFIASCYGEDPQLVDNTGAVSFPTVNETRYYNNTSAENVEGTPEVTPVKETVNETMKETMNIEDTISPDVIESSLERTAMLSAMSDSFEADFTDRDMQQVNLALDNTAEAADYALSAENVKITVQRLKQRPDEVPLPNDRVKSRVYGYHNMYVSGLDRTMIKDASVKFRVERQWVRENRLNRDSIRLMRYHGRDWIELKTRVLRVDERYVYCEATTTGFSIFAIVADTLGEEEITGTAIPDTTSTKTAEPTNTQTKLPLRPTSQPGFGALQFLTGLAAVSYLMRKRL